jgi:hypothetical protein
LPIPRLPPVTNATLPENLPAISLPPVLKSILDNAYIISIRIDLS